MKGISHSQSSLYVQPEAIRGFDFTISEKESVLLNDTNASEIQRILASIESNCNEEIEPGSGVAREVR
jgi:hypothetical protein